MIIDEHDHSHYSQSTNNNQNNKMFTQSKSHSKFMSPHYNNSAQTSSSSQVKKVKFKRSKPIAKNIAANATTTTTTPLTTTAAAAADTTTNVKRPAFPFNLFNFRNKNLNRNNANRGGGGSNGEDPENLYPIVQFDVDGDIPVDSKFEKSKNLIL